MSDRELELKRAARQSLIAMFKKELPEFGSHPYEERELIKLTIERMEEDEGLEYNEAFDLVCKEHPEKAEALLAQTRK